MKILKQRPKLNLARAQLWAVRRVELIETKGMADLLNMSKRVLVYSREVASQ